MSAQLLILKFQRLLMPKAKMKFHKINMISYSAFLLMGPLNSKNSIKFTKITKCTLISSIARFGVTSLIIWSMFHSELLMVDSTSPSLER